MAATYGGVTYANGGVPAGILAPLDDQPYAQLRADAADAWNRARRAVIREADVMLTVRGWNRTLAEQEKFFLERYRLQASGDGPYDDVRWWNGRRYVRYGTAAAAIPGTSNHGWGLAVDVVDYGTVGQFDYPRRVQTFPTLARHGWTDTEGRGKIQEPWHLVYDPTKDTHPQEGDDMYTDDDRAVDTATRQHAANAEKNAFNNSKALARIEASLAKPDAPIDLEQLGAIVARQIIAQLGGSQQ